MITPRPWKLVPSTSGEYVFLTDVERHTIANVHLYRNLHDGNADAAHIVKCVNTHEELVQLLKDAHRRLCDLGEQESNDLLLPRIENALAEDGGY